MSQTQDRSSSSETEQPLDHSNVCPVDHHALSRQKTGRVQEPVDLPVEYDEQEGVWHVRGFEAARAILRSGNTKQAGFNAEQVTSIKGMKNRPILYQEGKVHQQQRKQTARFFTPKTVSTNYRQFMEQLADQLVERVKKERRIDLAQLSLVLAVQVASRVVGLTDSRLPGMDNRLDSFFHQASGGASHSPLLRWKPLRTLSEILSQRQILSFFFLDVRPAIRVRKRQPQEDVISHLLSLNYSEAEILTECVTYAAAGMVTTREFISMVAWHFLEHPDLRAHYIAAQEEERFEILHEVLRLEPIVGHLYRRTTAELTIESQDKQIVIPADSLINLHIYATNSDPSVVGEEPLAVCPERPLHGERITSMLMGFGDGAHRCPGSFLAIQETDIFLKRLLALDGLRIERQPTLAWNAVSTGYELRDFILTLDKK
ncbi:cytochrome P450 [Ktedonobacteria bacterium brp13]|nr:cytochrome P450 [Ktedonobacteria bacterium brp13]